MRRFAIAGELVLLLCGVSGAQDFGNIETVVTGLAEPVSLSPVPGDDTRLIVAERGGRLRTISVQTDAQGNKTFTLLPQPFLDLAALDVTHPFFRDAQGTPLRDQSGTIVPRLVRHGGAPVPFSSAVWLPSRQVEQGFYSVAFAPDYATSGLLYVNYNQSDPNTDPLDAVPDGAIDWTYFTSGGNYCTQNGRRRDRRVPATPTIPTVPTPLRNGWFWQSPSRTPATTEGRSASVQTGCSGSALETEGACKTTRTVRLTPTSCSARC